MTLVLMIVLFVLLIFPHELGHFLAARACNVQVNEFSFGMGPVIFKKQGKETQYSIRAVPVGGFCAMEGEDTEDAGDNPRAFNNKKWWQKIFILLAGATMNILIAFVVMIFVSGIGGIITTKLAAVSPGGPADIAGVMAGDIVIAVEEEETDTWGEVVNALDIAMKNEDPVSITVKRNGEVLSFTMPYMVNEEGRRVVGIEAEISHSPGTAIKSAAIATGEMFTVIVKSLRELLHSENVLEQVSGPVGIAQEVGKTTSYGFMYYLYLVAMISVNLAIFNLLPFPALDGGRIIFVIIRAITGKAISDKVEGIVHMVGMVFLIGLAIIITGSDLFKLFTR
ncbi:MAG: RIP metalloprotease RseP [Firmicutes bacterium]|nr:RIP metalloprotease RseP [Bacillota bacterium]